MENWRWARCESALKDYNDIDKYVAKIEKQIRVPHKESDINADIKGTRIDNDLMFDTMWTIETHKAINRLKKNKKAIASLLSECDEDTKIIIEELHLKKWPKYTLYGLVEQKKVSCARGKATKLRQKFFEELDKKLDE
ncbi:integrase [Vagococcus fluvialis]|uniref:integrase n=1 Tax=Vagococcus fluvialis TaxID=2738 RepID=UPI002890E0A1|nr:integrase [Vagococcus fluvialis]MDT2782908.1 integrase [Vagococcus fluvialis]